MQQDQHAQLLAYLDLTIIPEKEEPAVLDFTVTLFKYLGYVRRQRVARTRVKLPLLICGENKHAQADALLLNTSPENDILLLVQACKRLDRLDPVCAKAQLVAQAVPAFNENNAQREAAGYPPIEGKGGIVMVGTSPIFFKIPATQNLAAHIRNGTYPPEETHVIYCYPSVPRPSRLRYGGMKPLDNRREILRCYEAFRAVVGI
ncbi:hypothetical protein ONZ45_g1219 [Pleurotus djamor]|nr:hypothetical protein ONZ45_g1219 [Pleurotus djamor]